MTDRTVRVRVVADTSAFAGPMRGAVADAERLGTTATRVGRTVRGLGDEGTRAQGGLRGLGAGAAGAGRDLTDAEGGATRLRTSLRGVTGETGGTVGAFGRLGAVGGRAFTGATSGARHFLGVATELGVLLAGGEIVRGIDDIVHEGNDYTNSLNKFQEVTRASGLQMNAAAREAQALGADLRLPEANASEAADAMVELAKAGLSAGDAITATRGTIQLASAARTDVATAARIEGDALDQFGLKAKDATMVADTLANVSNNTSGELTDLAYALKYAGPVAHGVGINIQELATAVGLLGKSGIIGETAGTGIRSMLVNLSKPTTQVKKGLRELGIEAYDSQGRFKGLGYIVGQLSAAQKSLTNQQFTAAAAMAFGKPALSAAVALAHQGSANFDQMAIAVGRQGGAAALAAAESKGLGGAMKTLGKELDSTVLQLYTGVSPALERVARGMSSGVADALPYIKRGIHDAEDLWDIYGPGVESKLAGATAGISRELTGFVPAAEHAVEGLAQDALPLLVTGAEEAGHTLHNAAAGSRPFVAGMDDLFHSVSGTSGALGVLDGRIQVGMHALGDSTAVLKPVGGLVGGLAHDFAQLPGPIQLSVISMLAMRPFRSQIQGLQQTVVGYGRAGVTAFRGIGDAALYQRVLAAGAGQELGRFGGYVAELEARSPGIAAMGTAFRGVYQTLPETATSMQRVSNVMGGLRSAAAVGAMNGLRAAGRGVMGLFGGPWGLALTAGFTLLDVFSQHQQKAQQQMAAYTQAIEQDSGAVGANTRALVAQNLQQSGALATAQKYGVSLGLVEDAAMGNRDAYTQVNEALRQNAMYLNVTQRYREAGHTSYVDMHQDAQDLLQTLSGTSGALGKTVRAYEQQQAAINGATSATGDAADPTQRLKGLIASLGSSESDATTRANDLQQALQLLSGGELDVQAAVANQTQAIDQLAQSYASGVDHAKGWGKALLEADGSLNATTENGSNLAQLLQTLGQNTASTAQATYDYAKANGSISDALDQSEKAMERSYNAAVKAGRQYGLTKAQAQEMAAQMGLIPSNLAITLGVRDLGQTKADLLYVQGLAGYLPQGKSIKVSALTSEAVKDLTAVGVKIETLPGGRQMIITAPTAKAQAGIDALIAKKLPNKSVTVSANTSKAITELLAVQEKVAVTKGKTITVGALNSDAIKAIEAVGFDVKKLPDKQVRITAPAGTALSSVDAVQRAINALHGKSVTNHVTTTYSKSGTSAGSTHRYQANADGNIYRPYADGGVERHVAQIAPAGAMRLWAEPETGGEAYIPLAGGKRQRSTDILATVAQQFGYRLEKYASGGVRAFAGGGFTYAPSDPVVTLGTDPAMTRYTDALAKLTDAVTALKDATTKTEKAKARREVDAADATLGLRKGSTSTAFDLSSYERFLASAEKSNAAWEKNLAVIGKKAGSDVEDTLRSMGSDGEALVSALAHASSSEFKKIVAQLKALAPTAAATLADYTKQLTSANSASSTFQNNLLKLAGMGYGDLANQLAGQGDAAAQSIAAQAVKSPGTAAKAEGAAKANANMLSGDDLTNALTILSVLSSKPAQGFAALVAAGLDASTIEDLIPKILGQIKALPAADSAVLLQQWSQIQSGQALSFARGGFAPDGANIVRFAERGTGGEAFIPLGRSNRTRSTGILSAVAGMFGYQLTPVGPRPGGAAAGTTHVTNHRTVHLHGAKQTSAEQAADIIRHMAVPA